MADTHDFQFTARAPVSAEIIANTNASHGYVYIIAWEE